MLRKFFISGLIKSGTTFLQRTLSLHPQIDCKPEQDFGYLLRSVNEIYVNYNSKLSNLHRIIGVDQYQLSEEVAVKFYLSIINGIFKDLPNGKHISGINDNGYFIRNADSFLDNFPEAKIIFIVRHPIDSALSYWDHNSRLYKQSGNINFLKKLEVDNKLDKNAFIIDRMSKWNNATDVICAYEKNERVKIVKYEDLVHEKINTLSDVLNFLEAKFDSKLMTFLERESSLERMKANSPNPSFYFKGRTSRGEDELSKDTIIKAIKISQQNLLKLKYDLSS